jgi:trehalose 6-phosphate synthase/phosphatase
VVLIQVATSTTENSELAATVSEIVTRIESVHSTLAHQPLVFLMQDIPFSQYLALLSVADVLMVTSLREGMNLTCHEYIFCQDGMQSKEKYGPIILSEFTGSAAVFEGNELSINPWDYQKCAEAIKAALEMDPVEKERRYNNIRNIVMHHTGEAWVIHLIEELAKVHDEHFRRDTMSIPRLSAIKLGEAYKKSSKRLFLLDYEGTLASYGQVTNIVLTSPQRVIEALNDLISDDKNVVYVMSGRTIKELQLIFDRVPEVGLIAENGCFVREYGSSEEWIAFPNEEKTRMWKESVKGILKYYEERVEGSWVEERRCSLIFHYEKASEWEAANRQAGDCANHINDACENQRVRAIPTKDTVCVQPLDWDKSTAAKHIINSMRINAGPPDFLMVAGNDRDDEIIFQWANELGSDKTIPNVTTVSVGNRNTVAMATLTQGTTGRFFRYCVLV